MSKERRQALRNNHMSTYKTNSTTKSQDDLENGDDGELSTTKSSPSSPTCSSDEADGEAKPGDNNNSTKTTTADRRSASSRVSGKAASGEKSSHRKYSPVVVGDGDDDDDDEYDYADDKLDGGDSDEHVQKSSSNGGSGQSDLEDYVPVTLRRTSSRGGLLSSRSGSNLTLNDFVKSPWKGDMIHTHHQLSHSEISSVNNQNGGNASVSRKLSSGYAIPADSLLRPSQYHHHNGHSHHHQGSMNKRPESWNPQPNLFYRTPSIVPSQWMNKRELPLQRSAVGPFGRSTVIVCSSRLSKEVTYVRRM